MTTDQGYTGGAEMQLTNTTPVATKAPGLNPNANVFHIKSPTTPPSESGSTSEWTTPEVDSMNNVVPSPITDDLTLLNGDASKTPPSSGIPTTFPPTPESPLSVGQADYTTMNGLIEGQPFYPTSSDTGSAADDLPPLDGNMPDDQLRVLLKTQLEYYFSRENLANDSYLVSQMDADQYVSITTIASFNQVKRLTHNVELVIEILRESMNVQVDETGEKVRPLHKRCIVILREIPDSTPVQDVERLFKGENCPPFISCEFAHNDNWYVTFDSEEDAQKAYRYLREEVGSFLGKPIMARIKAKPLLRSTFVPKNGFKQTYEPAAVFNQQKFTPFPAVPSAVPFLPSQQVSNAAYPFFPPTVVPAAPAPPTVSSIAQVWPTSPPLSYYDPGTAFAANGYTPSAAMKLPTTTARPPSYTGMRHRNQKVHRGGVTPSREPGNHAREPGNHAREQGNHAPIERSERSTDHDRMEHRDPPRDRPTGPVHDRTDRLERDRSMYHDRHMGGPNRVFKPDGSSPGTHHHNHHHHNSGPSVHPYRGEGRGYHYHHHTGPAHPQHGPHPHGPHSHPHSHSSHLPIERDRDRDGDRDREGGLTSSSRHSSSSDVSKEQMPQTQPPRRGGSYRGRRRPRGSEDNGANRSSSCPQSAKDKQPCDAPNFDLADTSFPPLPGSQNNTSSNDVFESKLSDVVKGTARPSIRDPARPASNSSSPPLVVPTTAVTTPQQPTGEAPAIQEAIQPSTGEATATKQPTVQATSQATSSAVATASSLATSAPTATTTSSSKDQAQPVTTSATTSQITASSKPNTASTKSTAGPTKSASVKPSTSSNVSVATVTTMTMADAVTNGTPILPPTPPQSPQKASKATSTDSMASAVTGKTNLSVESVTTSINTQTATSTSKAVPTTTTSTTTAASVTNTSAAAATTAQDDGAPKKLSYAQMAQRGKAAPAKSAEKVKTDEDQTSSATSSTTSTDAKDSLAAASSATVSAAGATSSTGNRSPPLRTDTRDSRSFGPRRFNSGRWDNRGRDFDRDNRGRDFDRENSGFDRENRGRDFDRENRGRDFDRENRGRDFDRENRGGGGFMRGDRDKDRRGNRDQYDRSRGK